MRRSALLLALLVLAGGLAATPAAASGAAGSASHEAVPGAGAGLGKWRARGRVRDRILTRMPVVARSAIARTESFQDEHGHALTLATDVPGLDLRPFAERFARIRHGDEIEALVVEVVAPERVGAVCGDARAAACYLAANAARLPDGHLWIPSEDDDLTHIAVHEYGHHIDNQLLNLSHLGMCSYDTDGSRNWFFERDIEDDIVEETGCAPGISWQRLLGELFAEDFTHLNGNTAWRPDLPVRAPTSTQLEAMASDIARPFRPTTRRASRTVRRGRMSFVRFSIRDWTFLDLALTGPRGSDFDLYLYTATGTKPLDSSRGRGRSERIESVLPPGSYEVGIHAYRGSGRASLRLKLE
jgi:hypothetical protein